MERLTERYKDSVANVVLVKECGSNCCTDVCKDVSNSCIKCPINKALEKLADYEDLEEQGLLLKLPLTRDKEVYRITYRWTECSKYGETICDCENYGCNCVHDCDSKKEYYVQTARLMYIDLCVYQESLGKTLFLIREEAEKKLKEMEEQNGTKQNE